MGLQIILKWDAGKCGSAQAHPRVYTVLYGKTKNLKVSPLPPRARPSRQCLALVWSVVCTDHPAFSAAPLRLVYGTVFNIPCKNTAHVHSIRNRRCTIPRNKSIYDPVSTSPVRTDGHPSFMRLIHAQRPGGRSGFPTACCNAPSKAKASAPAITLTSTSPSVAASALYLVS